MREIFRLTMCRRAQTPILDGIDRIEEMVSTLFVAIPPNQGLIQLSPPGSSCLRETNATGSHQTTTLNKRTLTAKARRLDTSWESWGLRGSLSKTTKGSYTHYSVGFTIALPLARILGSYALTGVISIRSCPLAGNLFTFRHPSYFAMARLLDDDHPFFIACRNGDLAAVRVMLQSGEGRPTDIDCSGDGPLVVCSKAVAKALSS